MVESSLALLSITNVGDSERCALQMSSLQRRWQRVNVSIDRHPATWRQIFSASQTSAPVGDCVRRLRQRLSLHVRACYHRRPSLSGGCCICLEQSAGDSTIIALVSSFVCCLVFGPAFSRSCIFSDHHHRDFFKCGLNNKSYRKVHS